MPQDRKMTNGFEERSTYSTKPILPLKFQQLVQRFLDCAALRSE